MTDANRVQRQSGVALWRQIADRIRTSIVEGDYDTTGMVPPETVLADTFGVNRHTIRSALAALGQEGIVRAVQGRGTLIEDRQRISFPISRRTRFTAGIGAQASDLEGLLLASGVEPARAEIATALQISVKTDVLRIETVRKADRRPVSVSTSWFPLPRFAGIDEAYGKTGSITEAFAICGLMDYVRQNTEISATHADAGDASLLKLSPGAIALVTKASNADLEGRPVQYSITRFPADRVQLTVSSG